MKKSRILFIVLTALLMTVSFWTFVGFKLMKSSVNKYALINCAKALAVRYDNFKYSGQQREGDSSIIINQNLYDVRNCKLSLSFDIPKKYIFGNLEMNALYLSDTLNSIYINL